LKSDDIFSQKSVSIRTTRRTSDPTVTNIFEFPIMAPRKGASLMDVVLLHDRQMVQPKLSHLTIILMDHFDSAGISAFERLFENRYLARLAAIPIFQDSRGLIALHHHSVERQR